MATVTTVDGKTFTKKRFLSPAQCRQSAVRILAEMRADEAGQRENHHLWYGGMETVAPKIEWLYHPDEAAAILADIEKLAAEGT